MEFYRYQPLPCAPIGWGTPAPGAQAPQWFRLLTIAPGVGDETLELKIEIYSLQHAPPYETLSYCWGREEAEDFIVLNGWAQSGLMMIRPNLRQALLRIRLPNMHRRLWVDAICINQEDNAEKSGQIQIMRDIYRQANRTVVWLGLGDENVEAAFALTKIIAEERDKLTFFPGMQFLLSKCSEMMDLDIAIRGETAARAWESLKKVFASPWFRRVWVIQEVVASSWSIFLCGNAEASFHELLSAVPVIATGAPVEGLSFSYKETHILWNNIYEHKWRNRHDELQPYGKGQDLRLPLKKLIQKSANFESTDPRDQIFGLLGICRETSGTGLYHVSQDLEGYRAKKLGFFGDLKVKAALKTLSKEYDAIAFLEDGSDLSLPRALNPDYTKSSREVYQDITRFLLYQQPRNLEVLSLVQHDFDSLDESLPSWVPRYHKKNLYVTFLGQSKFRVSRFNDGKSKIEDNIKNPIAPDKFFIYGIQIGSVQSTGPPIQIMFTSQINLRSIWSEFCPLDNSDIYSENCRTYLDGSPMYVALGMTLIAGECGQWGVEHMNNPELLRQSIKSRQTASARQSRWDKMKAAIAAHKQQALRNSAGHEISSLPTEFRRDEYASRDLVRYFTLAVLLIAPERKLFWMSDGRLGLGPKIMLPGDVLYALHGGAVPFVLRPRDGHYIFIGEAYVHDSDLMWGLQLDPREVQEERLEIR